MGMLCKLGLVLRRLRSASKRERYTHAEGATAKECSPQKKQMFAKHNAQLVMDQE